MDARIAIRRLHGQVVIPGHEKERKIERVEDFKMLLVYRKTA